MRGRLFRRGGLGGAAVRRGGLRAEDGGVFWTVFQPGFELEDARETAGRLGVELRVLEVDILAVPEVAANPADRCYYCKKALFP